MFPKKDVREPLAEEYARTWEEENSVKNPARRRKAAKRKTAKKVAKKTTAKTTNQAEKNKDTRRRLRAALR